MPIDSKCSGCGKTLRVNDEFVGRKARCPACGNVYVVGEGSTNLSVANPNPSFEVAETAYVAPGIASDSTSQPLADSWSSLPTSPSQLDAPSERNLVQQPNATPEQWSGVVSPQSELPQATPIAESKFFVRTPNSMIYGPSDKATVLDWIDQGRLDDTCHIREEASEQWIGLAAWRFQTRKVNAPASSPVLSTAIGFGEVQRSSVQSAGYGKSGNGTIILVLGLASWVLCLTVIGGWICAILAIVFASFEFNKLQSGETPGNERWLVLLGMWLGIAHLAAWILGVVGVIILSIVSN